MPTLPEAMGCLSPSTAPPAWHAAVARAAQLLAPSWDDPGEGALPGGEVLGTLSLAVYTLAHEQDAPEEKSAPTNCAGTWTVTRRTPGSPWICSSACRPSLSAKGTSCTPKTSSARARCGGS